jgi:hypothetical protein
MPAAFWFVGGVVVVLRRCMREVSRGRGVERERWEVEGEFVVYRLAYSSDEGLRMADEDSFEEDEADMST